MTTSAFVTTVAVDCMGGDKGPLIPVNASMRALRDDPALSIILVGDSLSIDSLIHKHPFGKRLSVIHAKDEITMDDKVSVALRHKKDASMRIALTLVEEKTADCVVSCGNTAALMALARFVLKMLPGIDRPAIIAPLPTTSGMTYLLDLGANVSADSESLFQFGVMGSAMCEVAHGITRPRVALLNVGEEALKGNDQVKHAANLLREAEAINYCGFIEGDRIFSGDVNVVVCDGFVGNAVLKSSEGMSNLVQQMLEDEYQSSLLGRILFTMSQRIVNNLRRKSNPDRFNGASFIGINETVVKSHGGSNSEAFYRAINTAVWGARKQIPLKVRQALKKIHIDGVYL